MKKFGRNRLYSKKTSVTRRRSANVPVFCCLKLVVDTFTLTFVWCFLDHVAGDEATGFPSKNDLLR